MRMSSEEAGTSASAPVIEENASANNNNIRLRVISSDRTDEIQFIVKPTTALGRLKRKYSNHLGHQANELRFVFDGHRIIDTDTPDSLDMSDDDVVEVYQEKHGGM